ncbi:MAG: phosphatidylglycerophosphatase A [Pseudomonadota bacterium]
MRQIFLSFLGIGYLKPAPGTWGSLAAVPAGILLITIGGPMLLIAAALVIYFSGVSAVRIEAEISGAHDPGWIVIDEVVGQWIALLPVALGVMRTGLSPLDFWPGIVSAFVFFRLFDIWKPGPVGRADARDDAVGVMLDDVWAGVFAAICVSLLAAIAHLGFAI